jgi:hypothetical protein
MWWAQGVTVALVAVTVFGSVSLGRSRQWIPLGVWLVVMLGSAGWYAHGAWKLAEGIGAIGDAFRGFGGAHEPSARRPAPAATERPAATEAPPPEERPRWPRRLGEFPAAQEAPVAAEVVRVGAGRYGLGMEFHVRLTNRDAAKTVDGVRFDVWCFDNFDELVPNRARLGAHPAFGMISQEQIAPGRVESGVWRESFGANTCTRGRVWLTQVHFTDGTTWQGAPVPSPAGG